MSIEIKYMDTPVGAQQDMSLSSTGAQSFAVNADVSGNSKDRAWASLETGLWRLDGSYKIIDKTKEIGWWSNEISGSDGTFSAPPVLTLSFDKVYSSTGFRFVFSPSTNQWCSAIGVSWYNGSTLVDSGNYYPDTPEWMLEKTVEGFNKIIVTLKKTNIPGRFARVAGIFLGRVLRFGPDEIISANLLNELDPSCCRLPVDTMKVRIRDKQGREYLPQSNQQIELYKNGTLMATHYIADAAREDKEVYTFDCQSVVGLLEDEFLGGIYENIPVTELLDEILNGRQYNLEEGFRTKTLSGYLAISTRRVALQQVAFAIGAVVNVQGNGKISLKSLPVAVTSTFTGSEIFPGASLVKAKRVAEFRVTAHKYMQSQEREELVGEEFYDAGIYTFTFSEPHHSYRAEGPVHETESGTAIAVPGIVLDSGANWVRVEIGGPTKITAAKYIHNEIIFTRSDPLATADERGNVLSVSDATLVTESNAQSVLDHLYSSAAYRTTLTQECVITKQAHGDKVRSSSPWGKDIEGFIVSMDSTFTRNGHTANIRMIGEEVNS